MNIKGGRVAISSDKAHGRVKTQTVRNVRAICTNGKGNGVVINFMSP